MSFLPIVVLAAAAAAPAEAALHKFAIAVAQQLKGTEEFTSEKTATGYLLKSKCHIEGSGLVMEMSQELSLGPDRSLLRYRLDVGGAGQPQVIEARREVDKIVMQVKVGDKSPASSVPFQPSTMVLDNLVTAHFQALLDSLPRKWEPLLELDLLVPQQLAIVKGRLKAAGAESGTLVGKALTTRKYTLEIGSVLSEVWADEEGGLLRVTVPLQNVEITREGFVPQPVSGSMPVSSACVERASNFRSGDFDMPATLCLPEKATGPSPLLVLVHGSGPHDRDETIGPNKPFRDLAQGLAAKGIATLRYDKRTFAFRDRFDARTTVEEEILADAVAALRHARTLSEIDPKRTFVLGHSLGGTLAPFVVERAPETRGVILLAAAARPLDELLFEQIEFQLKQQGQSKEAIAGQIGKVKKDFARVRSGEAPDAETVFMASALYWRDLFRRDHLAALKNLTVPVLVLQGGQDVQVRKADYDLLLQAMAAKNESRWFANLNHLFMPVEGAATGAEYGRPGRVDPEVIDTIVRWVRNQS